MTMNTTNTHIGWRSLIVDNVLGLASLLVILMLTVTISAIGFLGFVFVLSGVPLVLAMIPLSFIALVLPEISLWRARWWFLAAFVAWAISPVLGGWLYPFLNSLDDQQAIVSDAGSFVAWTQWLWALPFLALYLIIGAGRLRESHSTDLTKSPIAA